VVLYTTTLRVVRGHVRGLQRRARAAGEPGRGGEFQERDVSIHGPGPAVPVWPVGRDLEKAVPPRLFVRGRDVGGAAQVLALHEEGRLVPLLPPLVSMCAGAAGGKTRTPRPWWQGQVRRGWGPQFRGVQRLC
jgi:glutaredoxin domain-containing cysteine-rich protein 1